MSINLLIIVFVLEEPLGWVLGALKLDFDVDGSEWKKGEAQNQSYFEKILWLGAGNGITA
jgi:hypothetical protein